MGNREAVNRQLSTVNMFYSGTSNLAVPEANRTLYPEAYRDKSKLSYYASLFNTVEINSTFKKLPMKRTIEKWTGMVGDDFQFTFKLNRAITHNKALAFDPAAVMQFVELANLVGNKKGCLLLQFPGKLSTDHADQLRLLLDTLTKADPAQAWKTAIEFRNLSWYHNEVFDLLRTYNSTLVLHDMPGSAPSPEEATAAFIYLRFHGTEKGYRGSYGDEVLLSYAMRIRKWIAEGKAVYTYFNNTLGNAVGDLVRLNQFVHQT